MCVTFYNVDIGKEFTIIDRQRVRCRRNGAGQKSCSPYTCMRSHWNQETTTTVEPEFKPDQEKNSEMRQHELLIEMSNVYIVYYMHLDDSTS